MTKTVATPSPASRPAGQRRTCPCGGHLTREVGVISSTWVDPRTGRLFQREAIGAFLACDACEQVQEEGRA